MADLIDRGALIAEYDRVHVGAPGGARKLMQEAPAVNRWISVQDALPEIKEHHISDTVLCYCDSGALAITRLEENAFAQVGFGCEKENCPYPIGKVLYWMPIPEIPEPPESEVQE